jgi:hypothetical protein
MIREASPLIASSASVISFLLAQSNPVPRIPSVLIKSSSGLHLTA